MLSQSKLDELVNGCQHLQTFGSEAVCIKGDEGLPSAAIPDLTLVPNEVANMGLKHFFRLTSKIIFTKNIYKYQTQSPTNYYQFQHNTVLYISTLLFCLVPT